MTTQRTVWIKEGLAIVSRLTLAVVFIWACVHKIANPSDFALQVATYQILPLSLVNLQAIVLPWVELVTGLLLMMGLLVRPAALVTCGMNIMFIAAIAMALNADLQLQCGCFASSQAGEQMDAGLIVRDIALLAMGAFLVWIRPGALSLDRWIEKRRQNA